MSDATKELDKYLLQHLSDWVDDNEHLELENQRIEEIIPGVLQYNLLEKRSGKWRRGFGIDCPEDRVDELSERLRAKQAQVRWAEPRSSNLLLPVPATSSGSVFISESSLPKTHSQHDKVGPWVHDAQEILTRLEDPTATESEQCLAVLFAEKVSFVDDAQDRLLQVLNVFIEGNRLSDDADRMVYLCSAIRKYAMNMRQSQFDEYCDWLIPTDTTPVHHEVEMEFLKGLSYRLQFAELTLPQEFPHAISIISDIAIGYLRRSLILQKSYANTAMLAIICIAVLEAISSDSPSLVLELLETVDSLQISWFSEMIEDNLDEAVTFVTQHNPAVGEILSTALDQK
ncbi:hypothetical protein [Roseimaritima ulvae]|uniref:Uncharacterized protein n=1 Tax=Roseimaritima ulvae TaxID=980254 RepID=A0A5B9QPG8_9BACT|nr:hypothetical protein [Roseimaritima ulvae]QEG39405.1 hypothetical protein UC8_13940 [Roseimaritima ulvae]